MSIRVVKLMIKPVVVKESTTLATNIDDKIINSNINNAQKKYLLPLLGSTLYTRILDTVSDGTITGDYKSLYDNYIIDCLSAYVKHEVAFDLNFQFTNSGTNQNQIEGYQSATMDKVFALKKQLLADADTHAEILRKHLEANYKTKYPEYKNVGTDYDAVTPLDSGYNCPIVLD